MAELVFKNFTAFYSYKKQYYIALDKLNLTIGDGDFVAVTGASGSGKTTLLKCIAGLHELTEGELWADGERIEELPLQDRSIAYVAQEYSLYPQMTVYENIAYPLRMMHTPYEEMARRVKATAKELEIDWLLTRKPKELSGGQQQRVAIARAIVKKPRVLLLDEPFSNLEPALHSRMRQLIKQIHDRQRQTILLATHDLADAFSLAAQVIVLKDGSVEQIGPPGQIRLEPESNFIKETWRE